MTDKILNIIEIFETRQQTIEPMAFNRKIWLDWETRKPCPNCEIGLLFPITNTQKRSETNESKEMNTYPGYNQTDYVFSLHLQCSNCGEIVVVSGYWSEYHYLSDEGNGIQNQIVPISFYPAPKIISIPKSCPKSISKTLNDSFGLYWIDLSSCANKIRTSIEFLMDDLKVEKTIHTKSGKCKNLILHDRILQYKLINSEAADFLLAIKWIGNEGSHYTKITKNDVLDAYELLEFSLEQVYNDKKKSLVMLSQNINNTKKPLSSNKINEKLN